MENLTQLFSLLSDPTRLKLLALLSYGERCVCKLHEPLGLQQSAVSRHLMLLRTAGVVSSHRVGTWIHYRLAPELWKPEWKDSLPIAIESAVKQLTPAELKGTQCQTKLTSKSARSSKAIAG